MLVNMKDDNGELVYSANTILMSPTTFEGLKTNFFDRSGVQSCEQLARMSDICMETMDDEVKLLLSKVDVNATHDNIMEVLQPALVPQLTKVHNFLTGIDIATKPKKQLLKHGYLVIILRELHKLLLFKCNCCGENFKNDIGVVPAVSCCVCGAGAHKEC